MKENPGFRGQDIQFLTFCLRLTFPGSVHNLYGGLYTVLGRPYGISQISGTWTHAERKLHILGLELKAVILALHHWLYSTTFHKVIVITVSTHRAGPISTPVTSITGSVPMATDSRHSDRDQTHFRLSDCDSGPSISTKSANNNRVESPP